MTSHARLPRCKRDNPQRPRRASCSICATIPAACSKPVSPWPMPSSTTGLIVSADGRTDDARFRMDATPGDLIDGAELVVLVNGGSASASEIVAGALQRSSAAPRSSVTRPTARARCRRSCRCRMAAPSSSPRRATSRPPARRSRPRASSRHRRPGSGSAAGRPEFGARTRAARRSATRKCAWRSTR